MQLNDSDGNLISALAERLLDMAQPTADIEFRRSSHDRHANLLGVSVNAINIKEAADECERLIASRRRGQVCVTGVHGVMEAQSDPQFRAILNSSFLTVPDGTPLVWVGRLQGHRQMGRVYGPDLMIELCRRSVQRGYSHFLYGGNEGVAEKLAECLKQRIPELQIAGTYTPPFRPLNSDEETELFERVSACKPDIIWVGLSTPKQERFIAQYIDRLETKLIVGVGAAFDIHTGRISDAPDWMKPLGLQWLHRLAQEPRRLWRRYLINNPKFILGIALQMSGLVSHSLQGMEQTSLPPGLTERRIT